jgi:hypothetical protein
VNLNEMRSYVRDYIDLDSTDLPNSVLDVWLREGYRRVQEYAHNWPHLLDDETVEAESNVLDVSSWRAVHEVRIDRWTLHEIPHRTALTRWPENTASSGTPTHYSVVGDNLYLWPKPPPYFPGDPGIPGELEWPGPRGFGTGNGAPTGATGGDLYFDLFGYNFETATGGTLYAKVGSTWQAVTLLRSTGAPTLETGDIGDYYANIANPYFPQVYGPFGYSEGIPPTPAVGGMTLLVRGLKEAAMWPTSASTGTSTPPLLPSRLREHVARWALGNAYEREGDTATANALRQNWVEELEVYKRRTINVTGSERLVLADGGGDSASLPTRMRYSWE